MPEPLSRKKKIIFSVVAIVIFLFAVEWIFDLVINRQNRLGNAEKVRYEAYRDKPWAEQYFKDGMECDKQVAEHNENRSYQRYVLFDLTQECATTYINYHGTERKTWNPDPATYPSSTPVRTVGMFGGSTMLGLGTIDDLTIPSHFSRLINTSTTNPVRYRVSNWGVGSYTFTQSLMKLVLLLRQGKRFDYIVFYGGANDIDNAYDEGAAGALYNEGWVKTRLEGSMWDRLKEFAKEELNACTTCKGIVIFSRNVPFFKDYISPILVRARDFIHFKAGQKFEENTIPTFAAQIAEEYKESHNLLDSLSKAYGFTYSEFWQPAMMFDDRVVGDEKLILNIDPRLTDPKLKELYRTVRSDVDGMKLENYYDVSSALDDRTGAEYLDAVHPDADGNGEVAQAIYAAIAEKLP